jgi:Icc protein
MLCVLAVAAFIALLLPAYAQDRDYTHLVILSDPHLPGRIMPMKEKALQTINSWKDVDMVAVLGDICNDLGTKEEYAYAKRFFSQLKAPVYPITGNHDYLYEDNKVLGKRVKASPEARRAKLDLFKETFSLEDWRYSKKAGPYQLLFLSVDSLSSSLLAELSEESLAWLEATLKRNPGAPTILFFHAPLKGTLMSKNRGNERDDFIAQPYARIQRILLDHPQVFLWASGHMHIAPTNAKFIHPVNGFENQVTNVHNCDMDGRSYLADADPETTKHDNIWTNSLYLFPDKVVVKTYDHSKEQWMEMLERKIKTENPGSPPSRE